MKYLKRYESFINDAFEDVNINIDKSLSIVEKQVLNDFANSFWDLSLNSSVFTNEFLYSSLKGLSFVFGDAVFLSMCLNILLAIIVDVIMI